MDGFQLSPSASSASSAANDRAHAAALTDALNRSSHLNVGFPTRTIRITEAERSSRDNTPNPITIEDLLHRPRSNPRTRTPMRYESPLESDAFRMERPTTDNDNNINIINNNEARRISILPLAGSAVGTIQRRSYEAIDERGKGRSVKQGPSQRKIRKWNNQHFAGLASEIESSNAAAADVLFKAHRDAHLYRSIYDPKDRRRSQDVDRFMNDNEMKDAREQFFEGHGPIQNDSLPKLKSSRNVRVWNGDDMLHRIDPRLRRLVVRACHNSYAAAKVVELFESFIVHSFFGNDKTAITVLTNGWWTDLLLECPTLTHRKDSRRSTAQFFFHPTLPTGGFHRLLLHAVCQFHGLNVVARTEENYECIWGNGATTNGTRVLTATGDIMDGTSSTNRILLLQHLGENVDDSIGYIVNKNVEESLAGLRI